MRYLGKIYEKVDKEEHPHLALFVERVILAKTLKHLLRQVMRQAQPMYLVEAVTHFLNIIFSNEKLQEKLNQQTIKFEPEEQIEVANSLIRPIKKKQGKQKKQKKAQEDDFEAIQAEDQKIKIILPESLYWKPSDAWEQARNIAKARYGHAFPSDMSSVSVLRMPFNRLALLRDLCLSVGIHLIAREYNFLDQVSEEQKKNEKKTKSNQAQQPQSQAPQSSPKKEETYKDLPFRTTDIYDIQPVVKHINIINEDAKSNMEVGK